MGFLSTLMSMFVLNRHVCSGFVAAELVLQTGLQDYCRIVTVGKVNYLLVEVHAGPSSLQHHGPFHISTLLCCSGGTKNH